MQVLGAGERNQRLSLTRSEFWSIHVSEVPSNPQLTLANAHQELSRFCCYMAAKAQKKIGVRLQPIRLCGQGCIEICMYVC